MCRNLLQAFGGEESRSRARRPARRFAFAPIAKKPAAAAPKPSAIAATGGATVLIVDDEVLITNALRRMLAGDYDLTVVNSAEAAAELFRRARASMRCSAT